MKVLLVNTSDLRGGASVACNRLMKALNKSKEVEAKMLVCTKETTDQNVHVLCASWFKRKIGWFYFVWERFVIFKNNLFSRQNLFAVSIANTGFNISELDVVKEADVIHLHWINQGMLSLKNIRQLIELGKPVVWTLHDMWPFTGICHYAGDCLHFKNNCGNCFLLKSPAEQDISFRVLRDKMNIGYSEISFVACSQWLAKIASESKALTQAVVHSIPNPIDISVFCPGEKSLMKQRFCLDENKKTILFGAMKISDPRKGFEYFRQAMVLLDKMYPEWCKQVEILFLGAVETDLSEKFSCSIRCVGYIQAPEDILALYNAADLFVIPSLEDNLPNTVMEAMACGTPVVGFNTGGIPEMISHKQNGYIADYKDVGDLACGIHWVLVEAEYLLLSRQARAKVEKEFSEKAIADQYIELYRNLLNER